MRPAIARWTIVVGLVCAVSLGAGAAEAREHFTTLEGVPAEVLSFTEMAAVEGKVFPNPYSLVNQPSSFPFPQTGSSAFMNFFAGSANPVVFTNTSTQLTSPPTQNTLAFLAPLGLGTLSLGGGQNILVLLGLSR